MRDILEGASASSSMSQSVVEDLRDHQSLGAHDIPSTSAPTCKKINDSVYELYLPSTASMDILFFHGLQLDEHSAVHESTWRARCTGAPIWPQEWLPEDYPDTRVLTVSYDGSIRKSDRDGRMDLYLVVESVLQDLLNAGVGQFGHVILVGHSFGGLVIKRLCLFLAGKKDVRSLAFLQQIRGIFYFATPHQGGFTDIIEKVNTEEGELVKFVKVLNENLARINHEFQNLCNEHKLWHIAGLGETLVTDLGGGYSSIIVREASARCGNFMCVKEDHFSISQPRGKNSSSYQFFAEFIHDVQQKIHPVPVERLPQKPVHGMVGLEVADPAQTMASSSVKIPIESLQIHSVPVERLSQKPVYGMAGLEVAGPAQTMASSSVTIRIESLLVILAKTSPRDVSRLASVNRMFAEAAKSDMVWDKMLPPDYKWAVENAYGGPVSYQSLKRLYDRLCGHVLVEDGLKGYGCDRKTGRMYRTFAARTLGIAWGDDSKYWQWMRGSMVPGARFAEVAHLVAVYWFRVQGEIRARLVPGTYTLCWVLNFSRMGGEKWGCPVTFTFTAGGDVQSSEMNFPPRRGEERVQWKDDDWLEYRAGVFTVDENMREVHLKFEMRETVDMVWKKDLLVDGVVICSVGRWK